MKKKTLILTLLTSISLGMSAQQLPYQNPQLSAHDRAVDLCSRLTLQEKSLLMCNGSPAIERLGIPQFDWWSESLHGVARNGYATVFPQTIGMAAAWDDALLYKVFTAISDEGRAKHNEAIRSGQIKRYQCLSVWTPNINIFRDPRWGRGQETYGEDPYLTTRMGLAVVNGLQGQPYEGTPQGKNPNTYYKELACAKHFAVHSGPEWNRHYFNIETLPARDLWETYLPAFKSLVQEGNVREVMCAYQRFENMPCCGSNKLLQQILRDDWKFDGLVVSDCGAISDFWQKGRHEVSTDAKGASAMAVRSGTDVECGSNYKSLPEAVKAGEITMEDIDRSVVRLLQARFELGDFDSAELVPWKRITTDVVASAEHRQMALDMARETMTLLQNNNALLPLSKDMKIAVMGPNATDSVTLWANYNGFPISTTTLLNGIKEKAANVRYINGAGYTRNEVFQSFYGNFTAPDGSAGMLATYWNNTKMQGTPAAQQLMREPINQSNGGNTVFAPNVELEHFSATYEGTFHPTATQKLTLSLEADDMARIIINGDTILNNWKSRERMNVDKRDFLFEEGKEYAVRVEYVQQTAMAVCKFDVVKAESTTAANLVAQVGDADVVIFCGGISPRLEGEEMKVSDPGFKGGDRTSIELPQSQREIVRLLHEAGKHIVFVNLSGCAMALTPESENCEAILQAWYPGEAGGKAVADVLFGDYNPQGKLPVTFYKSDKDLPDFLDYTMTNRTYRYFKGEALYPFGHGLSYTTFAYGTPKYKKGEVQVAVTNTGKRAGTETVQLYVKNPRDMEGPTKTLRGFLKVVLQPGETKTVTFPVTDKTFELWDASTNTMRTVKGKYQVMVGSSSKAEDLLTVVVNKR